MSTKKKILFSLMGAQPGPVFNATQLLTWSDLFIFYSDKFLEEAVNAKNKLKDMHPNAEIDYVSINPFDLRDSIKTIIITATDIIKRNKKEGKIPEIIFNITGGTDVMTSAALLAGIMLKVKLYYIKTKRDEETGEYRDPEIVDINPPQLFIDEIDDQKYIIIKTIFRATKIDKKPHLTTQELASLAHFNSSAALKRHLDKLEQKGVVQTERKGKYRYITLTDNGEIFYHLKQVM